MKVHDSHDVDAGRLDAIEKAVGEFGNEHAPETTAERRAAPGDIHEPFVRPLNREEEVEAQPSRLSLVELGC
jgi:hypothetical protein